MRNPVIPEVVQGFTQSASAVLEFLSQRIPFELWMVTRTEGEDWIVLSSIDHGDNVVEGSVFKWSDSFCSRMVAGRGPRIAPRSNEVAAYREAPINDILPIGAYIGVPIQREDGSSFGTLCAIDPKSQPDSILAELPLVELLATLLESILECELRIDSERRRAERAEAESMIDELTGLGNRRAWERTIDAEEARCARYGDPASVLIVDLDNLKQENDEHGHAAGDLILKAAALAIQAVERDGDFSARIGGDEFGLLAVHANALDAEMLRTRIVAGLTASRVKASVGVSTRHPSEGLRRAIKQADARMYAEKLRGRTG